MTDQMKGMKSALRVRMSVADARDLIGRHQPLVEDFLVNRATRLRTPVRVDHGTLVRVFLQTGSYARAAQESGVGSERVDSSCAPRFARPLLSICRRATAHV